MCLFDCLFGCLFVCMCFCVCVCECVCVCGCLLVVGVFVWFVCLLKWLVVCLFRCLSGRVAGTRKEEGPKIQSTTRTQPGRGWE